MSITVSLQGPQALCHITRKMIIPLCFIVGCFASVITNVEVMTLMEASLLSNHTKRCIRSISFYHSGYFIAFGIFVALFCSFLFSMLQHLDFIGSVSSFWNIFLDFLRRLENNEYTYQCSFGLSFQAVRCEIYGNINRMFLLGSFQCLKYMQESFSYSDFNVFRALGFLAFVNTLTRQIISSIRPYRMSKLIINNAIIIAVYSIRTIYSVYNWREVVQGLSIEAIEVEEEKLLRDDDYRILPWLTIS